MQDQVPDCLRADLRAIVCVELECWASPAFRHAGIVHQKTSQRKRAARMVRLPGI
jgi:hypothetical protein